MKKYIKASFDSDKDYIEYELDQLRNTINARKKFNQPEGPDDNDFAAGKVVAYDTCLKDIADFTRHLANQGIID